MSKNNHKINSRLATMLVAALASITLQAQQPASRPTLVVGIMVDGLNTDYLELLKGYFSNDGFKKLMTQGVTLTDIDYGSVLDPTAASAVVMTGSSPAVSGIAAEYIFDPQTRRTISAFTDPAIIGNYTNETLSPVIMKTSTIGDEIRIATGGLGHVYSIAPRSGQALVLAGHAGNSGFWLNNVTGKWATTTFYKDVPTVIQTINHHSTLDSRLDTMVWNASMAPERYPDLPKHRKMFSFRHTFYRGEPDRFHRFAATPMANREVTDIAASYIKQLSMGKSENMDMLNIAYTLSPYPYGKDTDNRMEVMDSYIRLDRDLSRLFKAIETNDPGMKNTLVFLAGTPAIPVSRKEDEKWALSTGEFSPRRAISLLNMYLIALHGNGEWVLGYYDNQFFLNRQLIKDRDINLEEIRSNSADFLKRMAGVSTAASLDHILTHSLHSVPVDPKNINIEQAGDIFVSIRPGWEIIDDGTVNPSPALYPLASRIVSPVSPAFILAPDLNAQKITTPVDARVLAPTVSSILRIRSPNAAVLPPLRLERSR